jgi:hypothetical protein
LSWWVDFRVGVIGNADKNHFKNVRCVRGEQQNANVFVENGDGTVFDSASGLFWQKEDDNITRSWKEAINYCENLELPEGQTDWRLPNVKELRSIVDNTQNSPSIDQTVFPDTDLWFYWSSTINETNDSEKWYVHFDSGNANKKCANYHVYVRCVRGGL